MTCPSITADILYLPSVCAGCTAMSLTSTSRPCFSSRYQPLLSLSSCRSRPSTAAPILPCMYSCRIGVCMNNSCSCRCRSSSSCRTSGCRPILMRCSLLSCSIVTLSAKSAPIMPFSRSSRFSTGCSSMDAVASFFTSSSVRS